MSRTLRYGLLGSGMMGQEHIRNLALIDDVELVAAAEPDPRMREKTAALAPDVLLTDTLDELIDTDVDALVIATPNYQHAEQLLAIFSKTELPILVEKPLVTRAEDVVAIREAAAAHPAPVWVGMEYRFMPPFAVFREQLQSGIIGTPAMIAIREHRYPFLRKVDNWNRFNRNSGGTFVEKCCHFFDLMRLMATGEAISVMASAGQDVNHLDEDYDGEQPDILDNGYVIVNFASGQRALLDLCMFAEGSRFEQEISVAGARGKLECLIPGPKALWGESAPLPKVVHSPRRPVGPTDIEVPVDAEILAAGSHTGATYFEHVGFRDAVLGRGPVQVTVEDGLKAVVLGLAAQVSVGQGRLVRITEDGWGIE